MTATDAPHTIVIGRKPILRYVTACLTLFNRGEDEILLRARGTAIQKCVDVVAALRRGFIENLAVKNISIGSEEKHFMGGRGKFVSYIEILVGK